MQLDELIARATIQPSRATWCAGPGADLQPPVSGTDLWVNSCSVATAPPPDGPDPGRAGHRAAAIGLAHGQGRRGRAVQYPRTRGRLGEDHRHHHGTTGFQDDSCVASLPSLRLTDVRLTPTW